MKYAVWLLVVLLVVLHQDTWNWDSDTLIFGFVPISLMYHVCISMAAGVVWYLAVVFAWPTDVEVDADHDGARQP